MIYFGPYAIVWNFKQCSPFFLLYIFPPSTGWRSQPRWRKPPSRCGMFPQTHGLNSVMSSVWCDFLFGSCARQSLQTPASKKLHVVRCFHAQKSWVSVKYQVCAIWHKNSVWIMIFLMWANLNQLVSKLPANAPHDSWRHTRNSHLVKSETSKSEISNDHLESQKCQNIINSKE